MSILNFVLRFTNPFIAVGQFRSLWDLCLRISAHKVLELQLVLHSTDMLNVQLEWTHRADHAGVRVELGVLGLSFIVHAYDTRHWNDEQRRWCLDGEGVQSDDEILEVEYDTVWVCVGTNPGETLPAWAYAFQSAAEACRFERAVTGRDSTLPQGVDHMSAELQGGGKHIVWEIFPCMLDSASDAISNFNLINDKE